MHSNILRSLAISTLAAVAIMAGCGDDSSGSTTAPPGGSGGSVLGGGGSGGGGGGSGGGGGGGGTKTGGGGGGSTGGGGTGGGGGSGGGGGGSGGTGGGGNDAACAQKAGMDCVRCCFGNHNDGYKAFDGARTPCLCTSPGVCKSECAVTLCATPQKDGDQSCKDCVNSKAFNQQGTGACDAIVTNTCDANADCKAMLTCTQSCPP